MQACPCSGCSNRGRRQLLVPTKVCTLDLKVWSAEQRKSSLKTSESLSQREYQARVVWLKWFAKALLDQALSKASFGRPGRCHMPSRAFLPLPLHCFAMQPLHLAVSRSSNGLDPRTNLLDQTLWIQHCRTRFLLPEDCQVYRSGQIWHCWLPKQFLWQQPRLLNI